MPKSPKLDPSKLPIGHGEAWRAGEIDSRASDRARRRSTRGKEMSKRDVLAVAVVVTCLIGLVITAILHQRNDSTVAGALLIGFAAFGVSALVIWAISYDLEAYW